MAYSKTQLEALWTANGGSSATADTASAIALAESSGVLNAENHNTNGSTDYGLWQINSVHNYSPSALVTDPGYNARAAVAISNGGTNFSPWTTYTSGAYKKYLGSGPSGGGGILGTLYKYSGLQAATGVADSLGNAIGGGANSAANQVIPGIGNTPTVSQAGKAIGGAVSGAVDWTTGLGSVLGFITSSSGIDRVLMVVGGGILLLIAADELMKAGGASGGVQTVTKHIPVSIG